MIISPRKKILVLTFYLLIIALILTFYHANRLRNNSRNRSELQRIRLEMASINKTLTEMNDYRKRFHHAKHSIVYIEALYRAADENRLVFHEVTSDSTGSLSVKTGKDHFLESSRYRITVKGDFRSVVEYVRSIMNLQQFSRINELKIAAEQKGVTGTIHLEIFTFR